MLGLFQSKELADWWIWLKRDKTIKSNLWWFTLEVEFLIRRFWFLDAILQWFDTLNLICSRCVLRLSLWWLGFFFSLRTWLGINCCNFWLQNIWMRIRSQLWQLSKLISVSCSDHGYNSLPLLPAFLLFCSVNRCVKWRLMGRRFQETFRSLLSNYNCFYFLMVLILNLRPFLILFICIDFRFSCAF